MFSVASPLTRSGRGFAIATAIAAAYAIINIFFAMPKFYHIFVLVLHVRLKAAAG